MNSGAEAPVLLTLEEAAQLAFAAHIRQRYGGGKESHSTVLQLWTETYNRAYWRGEITQLLAALRGTKNE